MEISDLFSGFLYYSYTMIKSIGEFKVKKKKQLLDSYFTITEQ